MQNSVSASKLATSSQFQDCSSKKYHVRVFLQDKQIFYNLSWYFFFRFIASPTSPCPRIVATSTFGSRFSTRRTTKSPDWISKWIASSRSRWRGREATGSTDRRLSPRTQFFSQTELCRTTSIGRLWQPREWTSSSLTTRVRTSWPCPGRPTRDGLWTRDRSRSTSKPDPPSSGELLSCRSSWQKICSSRWK